MKRCPDCSITKSRDEYWRCAKASDGLQTYCKPCQRTRNERWMKNNPESRAAIRRRARKPAQDRNGHLLRTFGITSEQFDEMLAGQGGRCAICRTDEPGGKGNFHVDHCHDTGVIRGLLCTRCNQGLGYFGDDPNMLGRAIDYLASVGVMEETA